MIEFEKTAINVQKTLMQGVCYSVYKGENRLYGVLAEGGCATFIVISLDKGKIIFSQDAPGATGSWGVVAASDDRVYFGSYTNAGLYRYDPRQNILETIFGNLENARFIFSLDVDAENNVYGGTWPNCAVFKYNGNEEKLEFYDEKIVETENYVRMVLFNKKRKVLYSTISAHCHIIEYEPGKGPGRDILPEKYRKEAFARLMSLHGSTLSVYMVKSKKIIVIDTNSGEMLEELDSPELTAEHLPLGVPVENLVTGGRNGGIVLDIKNMKPYNFLAEDDDIIMGIWPYSDGVSLLLSSFEGRLYLYNTETGVKKKINIKIPRKNIEIRQLHLSDDGVMYSGGYLRGGNNIYKPELNKGEQYDGVGQCEGITSYGGKVYFGKYPGAYFYEYNPAKPWNTPENPREIFELKTEHNQDRPFAMGVYDGKLYSGSIPNYGDVQGALAIYDINRGTYEVKKDFSDSRSIISICFNNG